MSRRLWQAVVATALLVLSALVSVLPSAPVRAALSLPGHLYFTRGGRIYMSNPDGSAARQLTSYGSAKNPDIMPAVSRDGAQLAYVQRAEVSHSNPYGLYVLPATGGARRDISRADQYPLNPTWSPDGAEVAYDTWLTYFYPYYAQYAVFITRRVSDRTATTMAGNRFTPQAVPSWSPDGSTLVMEQLAGLSVSPISLAAIYIKAMRRQPSGKQNNEIAALLTHDRAHDYQQPIYSPDGRFIACIRTPLKGQSGELWVLNNDGTGGHALASGASVSRPAWSPDGRELAYTRDGSVVIVSAQTGSVLSTIPDAYGPAWGGPVTLRPVAQPILATRAPGATPAPATSVATPIPAATPRGTSTPAPAPTATTGSAATGPVGIVQLVGIVHDAASNITFAGLVRVGAGYKGTTVVYPGESMRFMVFWLGHKPSVAPSIAIRLTLPGGMSVALMPQPLMKKGTWLNARVDNTFPTTAPLGVVTEHMTFHSGATRVTLTLHITLARPGTPRTLH